MHCQKNYVTINGGNTSPPPPPPKCKVAENFNHKMIQVLLKLAFLN